MTSLTKPAPRIGIFGGTFDPIHAGHVRAASLAAARFGLKKVLFIPSFIPPHKRAPDMATAENRLAMVGLAVRGRRRFVASALEVEARSTSYSILTLQKIKRVSSTARLFFLLGADAFREIETWREWRRVLEQCRFIVMTRPGARLEDAWNVLGDEFRRAIVEVREGFRLSEAILEGRRIFLFPIDALAVSSTDIRRRVRDGLPIRGLVPKAVECYIHQEKLYQRSPIDKEI